MGKRRLAWFVLSAWLIVQLACTLPGAASPTSTPGVNLIVSRGSKQTGGQPSATPSPSPQPSSTPSPSVTPSVTPSPTSSETPTATPESAGPYVVKQIITVGGETISGVVCNLKQPFTVNTVTPKVRFNFFFSPLDEKHGTVTYAYTIPGAGESHNAKGTYTIAPPNPKGLLLLSMKLSDHVVFHGFDGNIPFWYKFNLDPLPGQPCP